MKFLEIRKAVQTALGPLYDGSIDGEWGPVTEAALAQARSGVDVPARDGGTPSLLGVGAQLRARMVLEFAKLIGGRETAGSNQSPAIDALWQYTSYPDGWQERQPYCAATVCAVAHRAMAATGFMDLAEIPTSPSVAGMLEWARDPAHGCLVFAPGERPALAGDIVNFLPRLSHTGLLAQDDDGSGQIHTMEGNTNGNGERDGDGFWAKTRPRSLVGHFIRLAATA